ncbi:preprotein translocase subunit SecE [Desulfoprunum benzoelyticum]|uniref:Protein translocase subunit SecE n=1 Tax=Desulfoprunum benzoelyticum TaxID=1506996 RepID=A0A840V7D6_9BACT|nr:preprotein translocase subunit SecE [Desulfoprunum benzoelyticum]MBB5349669.1 preprotein translocase subunit SecE [Desulfoprunum benzoelyticum]MBM9528840.1 preprotein translocase subunit SecE [Desulfoprunum benzoelyticum]
MTNKAKDKKTIADTVESVSVFSPTQIKKFVLEVKVEFGKIVWPDKKMTLGLTGIVVVMAVVLSFYLGSIDLVIGKIVSSLLR